VSANINSAGTVSQLDKPAEPDENITEENVKDQKMLARFLLRMFRDIATLKRRWAPRRIDYTDLVSTGTAGSPQTFRLEHGLGGPVVWWPVRITVAGTVVLPFIYEINTSTDTVLVLQVYFPGTLTIRVEESGAT